MNRLLGNQPDQITEEEKAAQLEVIAEKKHALCEDQPKERKERTEEETSKFLRTMNDLTAQEVQLDKKYPDLPPEQPIVVVEIKEDCCGCPTSWTGKTVDGKEVYVRYRWGHLSVTVDENYVFAKQLDEDTRTEEEVRAEAENQFPQQVDNMVNSWKMMKKFGGGVISYDGYMTYDELRKATKDWFVWPVIKE